MTIKRTTGSYSYNGIGKMAEIAATAMAIAFLCVNIAWVAYADHGASTSDMINEQVPVASEMPGPSPAGTVTEQTGLDNTGTILLLLAFLGLITAAACYVVFRKH